MIKAREKSKIAYKRACCLFPGGVNSPVRAFRGVGGEPFIVSHASGPYLFDLDGNRYVDLICSWGPLVLGHAHPAIVEAIRKQSELGTSYGACSILESELAEIIISLYPSIEMMRFVNSGTEAGMSVLRLARGYTGRNKILKFSGCYHGHVDSLLVQAGSGVVTLGLPDCAGISQDIVRDTLTAPFNDLNGVEEIFKKFPDQIAGVIIEPVVGNSGLILPQDGFLEGLSNITHKYGSLLIFDEVMTGFRVDLRGAQGLFNIKPDLTMLGKVIGGGLPVGAFGGRREIMQKLAPIGPVYQAGTLSGNPLAMAAGIATLKEWGKTGVFEGAAKSAQYIKLKLEENSSKYNIPLIANSLGTMFGFFFQENQVHNFEEAKLSNTDNFKRFFHTALNNGTYFAPSPFEAGFVSTTHQSEALNEVNQSIEEAFKQLSQGE